jgi:NAD(P)-dependent dehydrogenase (short-subunit alcohol dehydrogenase family)
MQLRGSTALITGGASGLGFAVAQRFTQEGCKVLILDLSADKDFLKTLGKDALFENCDVSHPQQVSNAIESGKKRFGSLHIAVNCAGIAFAIKTLSKNTPADLETFNKTLQVNLTGTFNVSRLAAQAMAENTPNVEGERGVIINTASIAAYDGQIGQVAYAASKGGIAAMTLPLARDLAQFGIRVMTIAPGIFDTPMLAKLPEAARLSLGEQVPFPKRLGKPTEFAQLAQDIVENPMLNGEVIRLDGALRMGIR